MEEIEEGPNDRDSFSLSDSRCIYRVPRRLRQGNDDEAYTPQVVSIGPLHHGKKHLNGMEYHKKRYRKGFLGRTTTTLGSFKRHLRDQEARLRSCYAEPIGHSSEDFLEIILVDAIFVIEFLLKFSDQNIRGEDDDYMFSRPWMYDDVLVDLRMLENQLPLFILEDLFVADKYFDSTNKPSISSLSYDMFRTTFNWEGTENVQTTRFPEAEHFVDLIRISCLPSESNAERKLKTINTPSITQLHRAGVKLKVGSTNNFFDIQFAGRTLKIPRLRIADSTEVIIRNLIAFEQCHYEEKYISDYIALMDRFVNTPKDVELLVKYDIVENFLGDNSEVSTLINKLGKGVQIHVNNFYFASVCEVLNTYYRAPWNKRKANLRQNYFNTPWAIISFVAAVSLLILTFIQAVCSIISIA